jgi:hypothetical protein
MSMAAVSLVGVAARFAVSDNPSEALRLIVNVTLNSINCLAIVGFAAAAVFYAGAISPALVIRKSLVFGLTTALLLFVFATVAAFMHHQIVRLLHVTDTFASSLLGGLFGLTFHPVKHYFEHLLKRYQERRGGKSEAHQHG